MRIWPCYMKQKIEQQRVVEPCDWLKLLGMKIHWHRNAINFFAILFFRKISLRSLNPKMFCLACMRCRRGHHLQSHSHRMLIMNSLTLRRNRDSGIRLWQYNTDDNRYFVSFHFITFHFVTFRLRINRNVTAKC